MADATSQDFQDMIRGLNDLNKNLVKLNGGNSNGSSGSSSGSSQGIKGLNAQAGDLGNSFKILGGGLGSFLKHLDSQTVKLGGNFGSLNASISKSHGALTNFASIFVTTGAVLGGAIEHTVRDTFKQYQGLREVGQTFGGSLIGLSLAAAHSKMSLEEYSNLIKNNGRLAKANDLGQLSRDLRENLKQFGELGMTTEELNDVTVSYASTFGLFGKSLSSSGKMAGQSLAGVALEADTLAIASGKARMEIMKDANAAMQSATLRATVSMMEGQSAQNVIASTTKATMFLASLPGEAGTTLSKMLADTIGTGAAFMTEGAQEFTQAGLYGVQGLMDSMADKVKSGQEISPEDQANFYQQFLAEGKANMATLRLQAQAGNVAAQKAIAMITDMESNSKNYSAESLRRAKEQAETQSDFTKNISNLQENFKELGGAIRETFWKVIDQVSQSPAFAEFSTHMKNLGEQFKSLSQRVFTPAHIEAAMRYAEIFGEKAFAAINWTIDAVSALAKVLGPVVSYFANLAGVAKLLALYFGAKYLAKKYTDAKKEAQARIAVKDGMTAALGQYSAGRGTLRVTDGSSNAGGFGPLEEELGGKGGKGGRFGRLGKLAGKMGKMGRFAGVASLAGGVAADLLPEGGLKNTVSTAASWGGMGAQVGMMFGPLGALIGGGLGALAGVIAANWEPIKAGLGKAMDMIGGAMSTVFGWVKTFFMFTPLGAAYQLFEAISKNGFKKTWDDIAGKFTSFFDSVGSVFSSIGTYLKDKFSWLANFDAFKIMRGAISALPGGSLLVKAFDAAVGTNTSGPASPSGPSTPNVQVEQLQNLVNQLQRQNAEMQKNMQAQQQVMMKILEALQHGNAQERAIATQAATQMKGLGYKMDGNRA